MVDLDSYSILKTFVIGDVNVYDVRLCGNCTYERKLSYEYPCSICNVLNPKNNINCFESIEDCYNFVTSCDEIFDEKGKK